MATIVLTTGVAGTGKSYRRAAVEIFNFLSDGGGVHWSNFPFYVDKVAREAASRFGKPAEHYTKRIRLIPSDELKSWEQSFERSQSHLCRGPFTYFKPIPWADYQDNLDSLPHGWAGKDFPESVIRIVDDNGEVYAGINLVGAHIAIDECHNFCKASGSTPKHQRELWGQWLGEIRHIGATVEFLTQSPHKLAEEITKEAEIRIDLLNVESERDPFFKIPMTDWYELKAGLVTGEYNAKVQLLERRCVAGRWVVQHQEFFSRDPFYFQFYNSYNKPQAGGVAAPKKLYEFQKRGKLSLCLWFLKRNTWRFGSRVVLAMLVFWLCFLGGGKFIFTGFLDMLQGVVTSNQVAAAAEKDKPASLVPAESGQVSVSSNKAPGGHVLPQSVRDHIPDNMRPENFLPVRQVAKYSIRLITVDTVVFSDRSSYKLGDIIESGPLRGEQIHEIDFGRRRIRTDKRMLLLGDTIEVVQVAAPVILENEVSDVD